MLNRPATLPRCLRDRSGSVLLEFALIAPILVTLLLAMFDLGPALLVRFKVASATQAVADIATQAGTVQAADVSNLFGAGGDVVAPFSSSPLLLRISNIASDGSGRAFVYWSCGQGTLPPLNPNDTVTSTPTGTSLSNLLTLSPSTSGSYAVNGTNTSFVMVESKYTFTPPAGFVIASVQNLSNTAYSMPRVSTYIGPSTGAQGYVPTAPNAIKSNYSTSASGVTCNFGY